MFLFIQIDVTNVLEPLGFFCLGLVASILAMTSGGEGAILFVPAFTFLGLDPRVCVGTAFVTQFFGKYTGMVSWGTVGHFEKKDVVLWSKLGPLSFFCIIFLFCGIEAIKHVPKGWINLFFGVTCLVLAVAMACITGKGMRQDFPSIHLVYPCNLFCLFLAGLFTGMIAVGVGAVTTFMLHISEDIEYRKSAATAVALLPIVSLFGIPFYLGLVRWDIAVYTILGVIVGGSIGPWSTTTKKIKWLARVSKFLHLKAIKKKNLTKALKLIYIGLTLGLGVWMLVFSVRSMI